MQVTPTPLNEELIVRYLLGELPEEQQVKIEDSAFQDQQYMQIILDVENDLIDEYVRGEIPLDRRHKFESHFLASGERRRKVEFARALAAVAPASEAPEVVRPVRATPPIVRKNPFLDFFRGLRPAAAFSFVAAALVLFAGATWLFRDGIRLRSQLSQLRAEQQSQEAQRQQLEGQLRGERAHSEALAAQLEQQKKEEAARALQQQEPIAPGSPSTIAALTLLPGLSRASNTLPRLIVRPAVRTVRLQVGIDPQDDYQRFRVELHAPGGERVWSQENLTARATRIGRAIVLSLPAKILAPGRYELALKGITSSGTIDDLGYYYFEVLKQ